MSLTKHEMKWCIENIPYIPRTYWEWLSTFRFDKFKLSMSYGFDHDSVFFCNVTDNLYKVTLYEIMVLATYSEIRNDILGIYPGDEKVQEIVSEKISFANENKINFSEFGTRHCFNSRYQEKVIDYIKSDSYTCTGTSNVYYAMKYNMKPIGTFPHEWVMFHEACFWI